MEYIIASLDRPQLQRYLSVAEVDQLSAEDLADIASVMEQELHEMGFWEQCAFVARCKLAEKASAKPVQQDTLS